MPVVSILLPTYKEAPHLGSAIQSVLDQSFSDWELLVIDDGLSQSGKETAARFAKSDSRIVLIPNQSNLGIQKSLNIGVAKALGKYIARIDDDDVWIHANKLEKQVAFLDKKTDFVLVGTDAVTCDENLASLQEYSMPKNDLEIRNRILFKNCFLHSSVLIRKSAFEKVGGYAETRKVRNVEDYDLWLRLGGVGKFANLDSKSVRLMISPNSVTGRNRTKQAFKDIFLALRYRNEYPHFLFGFTMSCLRLVFFSFNVVFPIPKKSLYKIQAMYKAI